jgi:type IV pilus assembly protein PilA
MTQPGGPLPPLAVQPGEPLPAAPSKLTGGKMVIIVIAIVALCGLPVLGIVASLAIYGVRKYVTNAKGAEATANVQRLATGIARCANEVDPATGQPRGLPESSRPVPSTVTSVRGAKYQSAPGEWSGAYTCAGFQVLGPQYFQYRWELRTPGNGAAVAVADLDADGTIDFTAEQPVACRSGGVCEVGAFTSSKP